MLVEATYRLANKVSCRDVTSQQKENTEAGNIFHTQVFPIYFSSQQLAHHIIAGLPSTIFQHSIEVVRHLLENVFNALHLWIVPLLFLGLKELCITELSRE